MPELDEGLRAVWIGAPRTIDDGPLTPAYAVLFDGDRPIAVVPPDGAAGLSSTADDHSEPRTLAIAPEGALIAWLVDGGIVVTGREPSVGANDVVAVVGAPDGEVVVMQGNARAMVGGGSPRTHIRGLEPGGMHLDYTGDNQLPGVDPRPVGQGCTTCGYVNDPPLRYGMWCRNPEHPPPAHLLT